MSRWYRNNAIARAGQARLDNASPDYGGDDCGDCDTDDILPNLRVCKRCGCGYTHYDGYGEVALSRAEVETFLLTNEESK
jgi:hypothetical protein